jgi:hypothetical protein
LTTKSGCDAGKTVEQPIGKHRQSTTRALFPGLKNEIHGSAECARFGEISGTTE